MPEKITNYLRQGLPSKIIMLCFLEPRSGYALANAIYGRPTTAKIYQWANALVKSGYLKKDKSGYTVIVTQIIDELQRILAGQAIILDYNDKKVLASLLSSNAFRQIGLRFYTQLTKDDQRLLDIVSFLIMILPLYSSLALNMKHIVGIPDTSTKEALSILANEQKIISRRISHKDLRSEMSDFQKIMNGYLTMIGQPDLIEETSTDRAIVEYVPYSLLEDIPNKVLKKLMMLNPIGEYVTQIFALAIASYSMALKRVIESQEEVERKKKDNIDGNSS